MKSENARRLEVVSRCSTTLVGVLLISLWLLTALDSKLSWVLIGEDRFVEWASAWCYFLAGAFFLRKVWEFRRAGKRVLVLFGLAAICVFIALEEISWGQRIFGYQPGAFFLKQNVQQETNLHNLLGPLLRDALFLLFVAGYGLVLPIWRRQTHQDSNQILRFIAPPNSLVFVFGLVAILYMLPISWMSQEIAELGLALALLVSAILTPEALHEEDASHSHHRTSLLVWASVCVVCAALLSEWYTTSTRTGSPDSIAQAKRELAALKEDFLAFGETVGELPVTLGLDERLYQFQQKLGQYSPTFGTYHFCFADDESNRAKYLIDPWHSPYWIVDTYSNGKRQLLLISNGPNRRRDGWPVFSGGDDLVVEVLTSKDSHP